MAVVGLLQRCRLYLRVLGCQAGQGMAEYGLILALVAVVCAAAFTAMHGGINTTLNTVTSKL